MSDLTPKQGEVLAFIKTSLSERAIPPSISEIARYLGVRSNNGVHEHLIELERKGYIQRYPKLTRGIRLTEKAALFICPETDAVATDCHTCGIAAPATGAKA